MKAFIAHSIIFKSKESAIIIGGFSNPTEVEVSEFEELASIETIFVDPDFNHHNLIEVQTSRLSNGIDPCDLHDESGNFQVSVHINENEDPILTIKDRIFELEHLSMELQERIHKVANEMYEDKMKTIVND